jgi:uncharacterized membrane protein
VVITSLMMHRQRAIVRAFEQAGVTTAKAARTAEQMGLKTGMAWHHLVGRAVLRCPGEGRYFLDVTNWQRLGRRRRHLAGVVVVALLIGLALVLLATGAR